jgi:hypothetical protein
VTPPTVGITLEQAIQTSVGEIGESGNTVDSVFEALAQISTLETTNFTNLAVETVELTHLEPVGEPPTPSPTLVRTMTLRHQGESRQHWSQNHRLRRN